ncbi:unnamed protein product [Choristocarpus tenellus]
MAIRGELSVGCNTGVASLADQIKRFKPRSFADPYLRIKPFDRAIKDNPAEEKLTKKCVRTIVDNFEQLPVHERSGSGKGIQAKFLHAISTSLSTDLDPKVGALYVFDENYWKRRCVEKLGWYNCQIAEHGLTWKQLFFETHASERLEGFDTKKETFAELLDFLQSCQVRVKVS